MRPRKTDLDVFCDEISLPSPEAKGGCVGNQLLKGMPSTFTLTPGGKGPNLTMAPERLDTVVFPPLTVLVNTSIDFLQQGSLSLHIRTFPLQEDCIVAGGNA